MIQTVNNITAANNGYTSLLSFNYFQKIKVTLHSQALAAGHKDKHK